MEEARLFAEIRIDPQGRVGQDLICVRCGYNLRGIDPKGRCPECGTPVGRSVRGSVLQYSDPDWVERIARGMTWIVVAIGTQILWSLIKGPTGGLPGGFGVTAGQVDVLFEILQRASELVMLAGFWQVTAADPGDLEAQEVGPRQIARYLLTVAVLGSMVWQLAGMAGGPGAIAGGLSLEAIRVGGLAAMCVYASKVALRIPDEPLAWQTRILMWGMVGTGAATVVLAAMGLALGRASTGAAGAGAGLSLACFVLLTAIAWLVFGVWSIVIAINFYGKVRECALAARYTWARDKKGRAGDSLPSR